MRSFLLLGESTIRGELYLVSLSVLFQKRTSWTCVAEKPSHIHHQLIVYIFPGSMKNTRKFVSSRYNLHKSVCLDATPCLNDHYGLRSIETKVGFRKNRLEENLTLNA